MLSHFVAALANVVVPPQTVDAATAGQATAWLIGLAAVCVVANQIMSAFLNARKLRGADTISDNRYASRSEVAQISADVASLKMDVHQLSRSINQNLVDMNRTLGRLEGAVKKIEEHQ